MYRELVTQILAKQRKPFNKKYNALNMSYETRNIKPSPTLTQYRRDDFTILIHVDQGPDSDDMSSFFPCEIDNAIQYINLGYGAKAPKIVILQCIF